MAETKKETPKRTVDYAHELVDMMLPLNTFNPKDDQLTVIINGEATIIQRGKQVKVPRYIYQTVMDAEEQKLRAFYRKQEAEKMTAGAKAANAI